MFARTVDDLALAELLMGPDGQDTDARNSPGPLSEIAAGDPPLKPVFAFTGTAVWDRAEPSTREAFAELAGSLDAMVDEVPLPRQFEAALDYSETIMSAEMAHELGHYLDRDEDRLSEGLRDLIARGREVRAVDYLAARDWQGRLRAGLDRIFDRYDAIITPASPGEAPGPETTGDPCFCTLWSFTGMPAINLPLMTGPDGLPLGVQIIGRYGDDARLLRTANWLARHLAFEEEME